jgi:transposase InsO family protein
MDNGGEFKREFKDKLDELNIGISNTIPYVPQSNSIVERSNGILKRIFNKLIFIHANQDYSKCKFVE